MTKVRASLAMLLFVAVTATVASAQKVTAEFDKKADFSRYKTFMWVKQPKLTNR